MGLIDSVFRKPALIPMDNDSFSSLVDGASSPQQIVRVIEIRGDKVWVAPMLHHLPVPTVLSKESFNGKYRN